MGNQKGRQCKTNATRTLEAHLSKVVVHRWYYGYHVDSSCRTTAGHGCCLAELFGRRRDLHCALNLVLTTRNQIDPWRALREIIDRPSTVSRLHPSLRLRTVSRW